MESVFLVGSEDVRNAGHRMTSAATDMKQAASQIEFALQQHQRFLDEWLGRLETVLTNGQDGPTK